MHLPSTNEVKWISDKKDLNTSSFKHLFNALLISLHSPRNFPTGCCKERREKMCIQHKTKNMAKQARVYSRTRLTTNRAIECHVCKHWCHIKCDQISLREYRRLQNIQNFDWTCPSCISTLRTLPFADFSNLDSSDGSFTSHGDDSCTEPASQQTLASEDYLENLSKILNYSSKDLRVAHLNICSLRYKIDELRLLQRICGFDILGISETHLDSSVPDNFLQIDGLQLI